MTDLIPEDLPKGKDVLEEGRKLGKAIELGRTAWCREKNMRCDGDYKQICAETGHITWRMQLGLSSVEDQVEAIRYLYQWGKETGVIIDQCGNVTDIRMGLPRELRDKAPKGTALVLDGIDDYNRIAQAAPIQPIFADNHIGSPNAVESVTNALRAGAGYVGTFSQYSWDYPYWKDDVSRVIGIIKAIGIMSEKRKDNRIIYSNMGDGAPNRLLDVTSIIGYALLEKYLIEDLCQANYSVGCGQLFGNIPLKIAHWLALHEVLKTNHNVICFVYGNTVDPTEDFNSNYALVTSEVIPMVIAELIYKTGATFVPVPVTEAVRVPTKEEIAEVHKIARIAQSKAKEFEKMLDFSYINEMRSLQIDKGKQFFENTRRGLSQMGVDITDPVQLLLAMRRIGSAKLEEMFHPGDRHPSLLRGISPFLPTEPMAKSIELKDFILQSIHKEKLPDIVRDKKIVVGSDDSHEFGLFIVSSVLQELGAHVINGGVDLAAEDILNLAFKAATPYIAISTHDGWCLDYSRHLMDLVKQRRQPVKIFMGGRLNGIVEGSKEPVDVTDQLVGLGINPCKDVIDLVKNLGHGDEP